MDGFDDVSVLSSVDESPPPSKLPRRTRRAFTVTVASIVAAGALAGAAVGLADEKSEPAVPAPSAGESSSVFQRPHECRMGRHHRSALRSYDSARY
jgi:uncharacterized membrane protein